MEELEESIKITIATEIAILCLSVDINPNDLIPLIRHHKTPELADYQFNLNALHQFNAIKRGHEADLAKEWAKQWTYDEQRLIKCVFSDKGFLGFQVYPETLIQTVIDDVLFGQIDDQDDDGYIDGENIYGQGDLGEKDLHGNDLEQQKTVLIEYSSPNIAKPFHMGHLRSTIIGNFLKNLYENFNYKVVSINYLGDWGKQYGLLALAWEKYGGAGPDGLSIKRLYELYVQINEDLRKEKEDNGSDGICGPIERAAQDHFKKMENGDFDALELWKRLRDFSIKIYKLNYQRLGIEFDVYSGESQQPNLENTISELLFKNLLIQDSQKGTYVDLTSSNLGHARVQKYDGTSIYLSRDLSEIQKRADCWADFEKCLYVVGGSQEHHFKRFFRILKLMGKPYADRCQHISFGQVIGMSTRQGNVIFLSDVLDTAQAEMLEVMRKNADNFKEMVKPKLTADRLGISAVIIQDLSAERDKDYAFDWDRITSFKGGTGPYLQYAHARLCSIFRKVKQTKSSGLNIKANVNHLTEVEAIVLAKVIGQYPIILKKCLAQHEPMFLVEYLMSLAKAISVAYKTLSVMTAISLGQKNKADARLLLFWAAKVTLNNGLKILGLVPIQAM